MNRVKWPISGIEFLIATAILLVIARYIWAKELIEWEASFFENAGLDENFKYLITAPVFAFIIYTIYKESKAKLRVTGRSVISRSVVVFAVFAVLGLVLAVFGIWFSVGLNA